MFWSIPQVITCHFFGSIPVHYRTLREDENESQCFFSSVKHVFFKANVEPDVTLRFSSLVVYSVMCFVLEVLRETFFLLNNNLPNSGPDSQESGRKCSEKMNARNLWKMLKHGLFEHECQSILHAGQRPTMNHVWNCLSWYILVASFILFFFPRWFLANISNCKENSSRR